MKTLADKLKKVESDFNLYTTQNTDYKNWDYIYRQYLWVLINLMDGLDSIKPILRCQENLYNHMMIELEKLY